jgi:hypothetical protein
LFPSQFSFSISNILIAQGLEQLESRIWTAKEKK